MKVSLDALVIDPTVQIRRSNHEPTIRRYQESFEQLPPVTVFDTPEGLLLADGFHRVAAAERLGNAKIEAEVKKGTRDQALEFAVVANTKNADPLTPEERDDGIRRLKQLHGDAWSESKIAETMSVSKRTVHRVFDLDKVKRSVLRPSPRVSDSHYAEVASARQEQWEPLIKAADEREWDRDTTRMAVRNLKDEAIPDRYKRDLLAGRADPVERTRDGELAVPHGVVTRRVKDMRANDAILAFQRALEALGKARMFRSDAILGPADRRALEHWAKELPGDIAFLQEVLEGAKGARKLKAV